MRWGAMLDLTCNPHDEITVLCRLPGSRSSTRWGLFRHPETVIAAETAAEIFPALQQIEIAVRNGYYAAGYLTYEAAPAFDSAMTVRPGSPGPLLWFGFYRHPDAILTAGEIAAAGTDTPPPELRFTTGYPEYADAIARIHHALAEGEIYQTNLTVRAVSEPAPPADRLFFSLFRHHPVPYAAFINTGERQYVSLSPELFLCRLGNRVTEVPMKGTAPRQPGIAEDAAMARWLAGDPKNRAENLMIVDMVRNDLGRVCRPGSIAVKPLFRVDTYQTVHQMISTVHGEVPPETTLAELLRATFPAASITGAPKIRAMEVIRDLETSPRGLYTGSIGCVTPARDALFNVAIRTLEYDRPDRFRLGLGGGIVADSTAEDEWQECRNKSRFTQCADDRFEVLETMLYRPGHGIVLLEEHLERARLSQHYFGRPWREKALRRKLAQLNPGSAPARIRMTVSAVGIAQFTVTPLTVAGWGKTAPLEWLLSTRTVDSTSPFCRHKTTRREIYDQGHRDALAAGKDEMIFCNERGEVTEGGISNLFLFRQGRWLTPPLRCGVLDGLWRRQQLSALSATEAVLRPEDLRTAEKLLLGNSVRGGQAAVPGCKTGGTDYSEAERN